MRLFGHDISIQFKVKLKQPDSPYRIDTRLQKMIFGSYSQYLEDVFLDTIFRGKTSGTYVDIGANDPSELSNTKRFYDRGWSGINVEPDVRMHRKLSDMRPRDKNLNLGIGAAAGDLTFYEISPNTLSTFNKDSALYSVRKEGAQIVSETTVKVISLNDLFSEYLPDTSVDFLSVDAEGLELDILSSNDWKRFRPVAVVVEVNQDKQGGVPKLLLNNGYLLVYHNGTNGIFVDKSAADIARYLEAQG